MILLGDDQDRDPYSTLLRQFPDSLSGKADRFPEWIAMPPPRPHPVARMFLDSGPNGG